MKNFLTVLSLSNLCFLSVWHSVIFPPFNGYHLESPPTAVNALALMIDVLAFAGILWGSFLAARRHGNKRLGMAAKWVFLFLVVAVLNNAIAEIYGAISMQALNARIGRGPALVVLIVFILLSAFVLVRWSKQVFRVAQVFVLIISPFILLTFFRGVVMLSEGRVQPVVKAAEKTDPETTSPPKNRVVWIVFDEFELRSAFTSRPSTLQLPELDRFAKESFFASNAYPPAGATIRSFPALITGDLVADAEERSFDTLKVRFAGSDTFTDWRDHPTIFSRLKKEGARSALVGWYHPYCRLFGADLDLCSARVHLPDTLPDRHLPGLLPSMRDYFWRFGLILPGIRQFLPKFKDFPPAVSYDENHIEVVREIRVAAERVVAEPEYSLVFIHFPAPHTPFYYDRRTKEFNLGSKSNYFDNLALIDDVFGSLREKMESSDTWDSSTVIVSSDHWWRSQDWQAEGRWTGEEEAVAAGQIDFRIPFIVKPAHAQGRQVVYDPAFNTVLTGEMVLAISRGEIATSDDIARWIDRNRSVGKTDY